MLLFSRVIGCVCVCSIVEICVYYSVRYKVRGGIVYVGNRE